MSPPHWVTTPCARRPNVNATDARRIAFAAFVGLLHRPAVVGERGTAITMAVEHVSQRQGALHAALAQIGSVVGTLISSAAVVAVLLQIATEFDAWGRLSFLATFPQFWLIAIALPVVDDGASARC